MIFLERGFASLGFHTAIENRDAAEAIRLQLGEAFGRKGLTGAAQELADFYIHFGLASGPTAANELIRRVEAAGAAQASRRRGRR